MCTWICACYRHRNGHGRDFNIDWDIEIQKDIDIKYCINWDRGRLLVLLRRISLDISMRDVPWCCCTSTSSWWIQFGRLSRQYPSTVKWWWEHYPTQMILKVTVWTGTSGAEDYHRISLINKRFSFNKWAPSPLQCKSCRIMIRVLTLSCQWESRWTIS